MDGDGDGLDRAGLVYGVEAPDGVAATGTTIVLVGVDTDLARLSALARATAPAHRLVVADPPRFLYLGRERVGRRWYVESIDGEIEPATFGDALHAVEQLALGAREELGTPPLLVGQGQGGCLALALAQVAPELLAGVAALDAGPPVVPGWEPPPPALDGLPVLLLGGDENEAGATLADWWRDSR